MAGSGDDSVSAAQRGDPAAVRRVLAAVGPGTLKVVRAVLGYDHPDVEDAVQESMLALLRALHAFRGECGLVHYACRIALRTAMAIRRSGQSAREKAQAFERAGTSAPAATPHDEALAARRRRLLSDLLAELPEAQAEALALRIVLGCSMQEVADATGAPQNTVRSRLRLAKEALAKRIDGDPHLAEALEVAG